MLALRTRARAGTGRRVGAVVLAASLLATLVPSVDGSGRQGMPLVWHVESPAGESLDSRKADDPINPASLVKVATTIWALERLGPRHRFETTFAFRGTVDDEAGTLEGDLIVLGGADPDFHVENAFLLARALDRIGVRSVTGRVVVSGDFWIGWEGGSERRLQDPHRRALRMAARLRDALDYRRWQRGTRDGWDHFAERRGVPRDERPRVVVIGGIDATDQPGSSETILVHRSNELIHILKRFNAYSNNDIERLGDVLGTPADLARFIADRWDLAENSIRFETLSGLGTNRLSPRQVVRLMQDLRATCARLDIGVADVLPVAGCDPGTLDAFPELREGAAERVLIGKTGTLTYTDNGITALAGYLHTSASELVFCVAAPGASGRIPAARRAEERWVLQAITENGGPKALTCGVSPGHSDADARVVEATSEGPARAVSSSAP